MQLWLLPNACRRASSPPPPAFPAVPESPSERARVGAYRPPAYDEATLLSWLLDGPVRIERACSDCVRRGCDPSACIPAQQFETAVEALRALERLGLVTIWLRGYYAPTPGAPASARARLTEIGRARAARPAGHPVTGVETALPGAHAPGGAPTAAA